MKKAAREAAAFFGKKGKGEKGTGVWPRADCAHGAACVEPPGYQAAPGRMAPLQLRQRCLGWTNRC